MANKHDLTDSEGSAEPPSSAKRQRKRQSSLPDSTPPPLNSDQEEEEEEAGSDEEEEEMSEDDEETTEQHRKELEQLSATQKIQAKNMRIAEAGVIVKVRLENFMCHYATEVDFGPQINFLIGVNGSGKSAVLTAITMALGGNAKATNRGTKGGDLIMEGKSSAKCCVTLANKGENAFDYKSYGKTITIERTLNKAGGGNYKIKNSEGKTVDTKKVTLDKILDHFNIQVDNPMTVLTQDQSRQFLASATAKDKYNFFLRGTQLAQLTEEYERIRGNTETMEEALKRKKEVLPELKDAYARAKGRAKEAKAAIDQKTNLQKLKDQLVWSYVDEIEGQIRFARDQINKEAAKGPNLDAKIEEQQSERDDLKREIAVGEEASEESKRVVDQHAPEIEKLAGQIKGNKDRLTKWKDTERAINGTMARARGALADARDRIAEEEHKLSRDVEAERAPIRAKIEEAKDELSKIEFRIASDPAKIDEADAEYNRNVQEYEEIKSRLANAQQARQAVEGRLRNIQATQGNKLRVYGDRMPELVQAISQERGWRQKPIGPIGLHVKLNHLEYARMLESYFTHTLNGFICATREDASRLRHLFRRYNMHSDTPILTLTFDSRFETDLARGEPAPGLLTVLRALTINDPVVLQALVNSLRIERCGLVPRRPDGDQLLRGNPYNVEVAHSADMYQLRNKNGKSSSSSMQVWRGPPRLQADVTEQVNALRGELRTIDIDIAKFEAQKQEVTRLCSAAQNERKRLESQLRSLQNRVRQLQANIATWNDKLNEEQPSNIAALRSQEQELEQEIEMIQSQYAAGLEAKEKGDTDISPLVDRHNELRIEVQKANALLVKIQNHLAGEYGKLSSMDAKLQQYQRDKEQHLGRLQRYQAECDGLEQTLEDRTQQASSICARPDIEGKRKDAKGLQKQIDSIERALREREKRQGATIEQIIEEMEVRKKVAQDAVKQCNDLARLVSALDEAWQSRTAKWTDFRAHISHRARMQFQHYLSNRGYHGKLKFDHEHTQLHLAIQTDGNDGKSQKSKRKDAKALSGGEKSFSTICLLLTMWEAVGCPLRCLDEFDVFMDAINRRISMQMMIETAKAASQTQFILITPLDMGTLQWGEEVKVTKLGDPKRSTGALAQGR